MNLLKCFALLAVLATGATTAKADYWTYLYLYYNGFQTFDIGRGMQRVAGNMILGTVADPSSTLGKTDAILSTDMEKLNINTQERDTLAEIFDNIGIRASIAPGESMATVELDNAIVLGDMTDKTLANALEQAKKLGLNPTNLQAMGQAAKTTARAQAFDQTLRSYEQMGGQPMNLAERKVLDSQIQALSDDQLNEKNLAQIAKSHAEADKAELDLQAEVIGRNLEAAAALNGDTDITTNEKNYGAFAPAIKIKYSDDLYKYEALGGIRKLDKIMGESGPEWESFKDLSKETVSEGTGVPGPTDGKGSLPPGSSSSAAAADRWQQQVGNKRSTGECYRYVKRGLLQGGVVGHYLPGGSASDAANVLPQNGFTKLPSNNPYAAPAGAVIVYGGGKHGHIEMRTSDGGFVSDYYSKNARSDAGTRHVIGIYTK